MAGAITPPPLELLLEELEEDELELDEELELEEEEDELLLEDEPGVLTWMDGVFALTLLAAS